MALASEVFFAKVPPCFQDEKMKGVSSNIKRIERKQRDENY
jgi:hypothetical protein